jgi:peptide/nickel transport system ATP-binding protein
LNAPLLSIQDLRLDFVNDGNISTAISEVNIEVNKGEIVAIVGESGSGKSVTSLSVLRLIPTPPANYVSGKILFTNQAGETIDLLHTSQGQLRKIRGNEISMIFQEPMTSLNPVHSCGNQVAEALQLHLEISMKEAKEKTIALFESVHLPKPAAIYHRYPHQLSGGQKQRVMIAMAISCKPSLLICDEPTTALDVTVQKTILQLIKDLQQQQNMGVIFITHDLGVVAEIADRVVVMYKGKIVEQGLAKDIYLRPQHPYTQALLACRPALHAKGDRLPVVSDFIGESSREEKSKVKSQNSKGNEVLGKQAETRNQKLETPLISVQNVKVWFPGRRPLLAEAPEPIKAVNDVSFDVYEGETVGLVGESGCGKTTLGRAILQLIKPTSGEITFKGKSLTHASRADMQLLRKEMQIIFQDPYSSLNPRMIIGKAIAEPLEVHGIGTSVQQRKDMVRELLEKVNLKPEYYNRYPHEFSGGQRQRIVIARALALKPSFIICDESVSALDVSVQAQVLNLLNDLKKDFGFTAIFISHDLSVVRYISDRILVMNKGKIEESGDAESIYHHPQSPYTKKLIDSIPKGLLAEH